MSRFTRPSDAAPTALSRRGFLITTAGGGLAFSFLTACGAKDAPSDATTIDAAPYAPTLWFSLGADGIATINIIRAEMGQHVGTALARILADELEIPWDNVRIKQVDTDPKWGLMVTGGSWSVWQTFPIYSQAGAAGRTALIEAGAAALGVDVATCTASNGEVISGGKKISYADIVSKGVTRTFTPDELAALPVKPAADRRLIGKPVMARDIKEKTNGTALYGIDAKVDGMVYARPIMPPTRNGSKVNSVDDSAAKAVKGYQQSLVIDDPSGTVTGWVMVIADTYPAAIKAVDLVKVDWTPGPTAKVSEKQIQDHASSLLDDPSQGAILDTGVTDTTAAFAAAATRVEATYTTGTALHMHLEPVNALAFEKDGVMEIHTGNQWQSLVLPWLATALGMPEDKIVMRTYRLGGGFGRRLNGDYAVPAALAAKVLGKPVKMVLTREDDTRMDSVRSPSVQRLRLAADADGKVTGMEQHVAAGWPTQVMAPFFMPNGTNGVAYDPFAISGADHWYTVGAHRVRAVSNDLANSAFRPGWLRSVGPGFTNWALESFMDEAAHALGKDPVEFRLSLLDGAGLNAGSAPNAVGGALRQAEVVRRCAAKAGWGKPLPADTGIGLATSFGQERGMPTWVACAAQVHVDRTSGRVTAEKLTLVADAGTIVDPDGALAQMQGASLWGLSLALHEGTEFVNGQVKDLNLGPYTPLRLADVPDLDISFVDSTEVPVGLGEPATTVVGPAIGNAIFNAVGARLRHIPIKPSAVLAAI
ncbi:xanthine dehydrogenase family protein molybdopterin-binding subunit [Hyphomonas johnsonii]|uniref:Putative membrane-bound aldehyde dehydrogenase (Pyrroloquinoline-quinone-linked) n=1 Tax=Hyphomonas johnsonii MHS-2 TaxID=1280950 RepID=A0A059FJ84_9PROT|nr:molybdopterin cofactor-binding domain-containing protein [Hyphomonas johnsonii]KCZ90704.1 putative membrane-bound aldehyde dehydrogenase (pyrroloquinoline-quinone-linked) [Hyphomonas johnsonii MHS-2]